MRFMIPIVRPMCGILALEVPFILLILRWLGINPMRRVWLDASIGDDGEPNALIPFKSGLVGF